jgi:hypothetical protein
MTRSWCAPDRGLARVRSSPRGEHASRAVENLADPRSMLDELGARRFDVVDDEIQAIG